MLASDITSVTGVPYTILCCMFESFTISTKKKKSTYSLSTSSTSKNYVTNIAVSTKNGLETTDLTAMSTPRGQTGVLQTLSAT